LSYKTRKLLALLVFFNVKEIIVVLFFLLSLLGANIQ